MMSLMIVVVSDDNNNELVEDLNHSKVALILVDDVISFVSVVDLDIILLFSVLQRLLIIFKGLYRFR